jgi:radical SAM superfamily enzyme YgiQ (UPF0313 family)
VLNTALVNLPYPKRVMRRWVASYYAPNFLMPPLELMSLGAILREWKKAPVHLIDAIAEGWDETRVIRELQMIGPDLVVTMPGFNTFPRDMAALDRISATLRGAKTVCFGYLPTQFPREILARTRVDVVIRDEPELTFSEFFDCLSEGGDLSSVAGIAYRANGRPCVTADRPRLSDLDALPFPDHSLVPLDRYSESYLQRPIGVIMSERGCPYPCTYCVRTYGSRLVSRSAESILSEIEQLRRLHGIRQVRFMDDTFTLNRERLVRICTGLLERRLDVAWTCLTRLDRLDREILALMKRSGCQRMYVGIESGSQRILDYYRKGLSLETIRARWPIVRESGIEASAFFVVGAPIETDQDVEQSITLAEELDVDYVIVTKLQYWPGTELFATTAAVAGTPPPAGLAPAAASASVAFDLFSGDELVYSAPGYDKARVWQKRFYRRFYLRPRYVWRRLRTLARSPRDTLVGFTKLCGFLLRRDSWDDLI